MLSAWFSLGENTGPYIFSLRYFLKTLSFIFDLLSSMPFAADNFAANEKAHGVEAPAIPVSEEAAETIWRAMNEVSTCQNTFNFFNYLVIFRHYFTGEGKVSCILTTISG